jgi:site-specific recombinase XerD
MRGRVAPPRTWSDSLEEQRLQFAESLRVRRLSPASVENYTRQLVRFFRFLAQQAVTDARAVTRAHLRAYQLHVQAQLGSAWTRTGYLQAVRLFFKFLEKTDAVLLSPCVELVIHRPKALPGATLTGEQAKRVLNAPNTQRKIGLRDRAILEVFYSTGLRLKEMTALSLYDVDYANGFVRVNKGKGGKDRVVPLGWRACRAVRTYLLHARAVWAEHNRDEPALWLQSGRPHRAMKRAAIQYAVRKYAKALGAKGSPHVWRRTCATHLLAGGASPIYVQRLLGHQSLETTQVYTKIALAEVKATFRRSHPRARAAGPGPADATASGGASALPVRLKKGKNK